MTMTALPSSLPWREILVAFGAVSSAVGLPGLVFAGWFLHEVWPPVDPDLEEDTGSSLPDFVRSSPVPLTQSELTGQWSEDDDTIDGLAGVLDEVGDGDTLTSVAARNGISIRILCLHNDITEQAQLVRGASLYVVPIRADAYWVVRPGQTLSQVAEVAGLPMRVIAEINGIDDPNQIEVGEVLLLRASTEEGC